MTTLTQQQKEALSPQLRALVQPQAVLSAYCNVLRTRFAHHIINAPGVGAAISDIIVRWWNNSHAQHITVNEITPTIRHEFMTRSSVTSSTEWELNGDVYKCKLTIRMLRDLVNAPPSNWIRTLISGCEADLKYLFGDDAISHYNADIDSRDRVYSGIYTRGGKCVSITIKFTIPKLNELILLGPEVAAQQLARTITHLAKMVRKSNNDVLNDIKRKLKIAESAESAELSALFEQIKDETLISDSGQYVLLCKLTESGKNVYMTEQSEFTSEVTEAYVTDKYEAEELIDAMAECGRIYIGKPLQVS